MATHGMWWVIGRALRGHGPHPAESSCVSGARIPVDALTTGYAVADARPDHGDGTGVRTSACDEWVRSAAGAAAP
jgi:hypothetical protein